MLKSPTRRSFSRSSASSRPISRQSIVSNKLSIPGKRTDLPLASVQFQQSNGIVELSEDITCVQWDMSGEYIACGTLSGMFVVDRNNLKIEKAFYTGCAVLDLCWDKQGSIAAACEDNYIRVFTHDGSVRILAGHFDTINSIAMNSHLNDQIQLASTGDDKTLRVWYKDDDIPHIKYLINEGVSVQFHPQKSHVLLLGEVNGDVRLYSTEDNEYLMQFKAPSELLSLDWCPADNDRVAALIMNELLLYRLVDGQFQMESRVPVKKSRQVMWSSTGEYVALLPYTSVKVKVPLSDSLIGQLETPVFVHRSQFPLHPACQLIPEPAASGVALDSVCWHPNERDTLAGISGRLLLMWKLKTTKYSKP